MESFKPLKCHGLQWAVLKMQDIQTGSQCLSLANFFWVGAWLSKYHTVMSQSSCISCDNAAVGLPHLLRFSCLYVHTVIGIRLTYHTTLFLVGRLCHQLLVCGYIVSLAVFVSSFVTLCSILSQHHFGNFGPLSSFDAWYFHPFLSLTHSKELFPCHTFLFHNHTPAARSWLISWEWERRGVGGLQEEEEGV